MGRAGRYVNSFGARCFEPASLPPDPPISLDPQGQLLLSEADRALARLDGASSTVPDPELFVYAFLRQEAVLSSQIEGTEASLDDLFEAEATETAPGDVQDVVNYLEAMRWGVATLDELPLSLRFLRELHRRLLASGRGAGRNPGEFRDGQNHIGPPGCTIEEATFVPPSVPLMRPALDGLERFLHDRTLPPLIRAALAHAQFETIHPFWDGNGRVGRMLVTFMLMSETVLERPLLYVSLFFKVNKAEYYGRLQAVREEGDWEGWTLFFLRAVRATSRSALGMARRINMLRDETLNHARALGRSDINARFAETLFRTPYVTAATAAELLGATWQTGSNTVARFVDAGVLRQVGRKRRDRLYAFRAYLDLLAQADEEIEGAVRGSAPATVGTVRSA